MTPAPPTSRLKVRVMADGMSAFASVDAGSPDGADELDAALINAGIVHGVDRAAHAVLLKALETGASHPTELEIARGTAAGVSCAGRFEPAFHAGLQPGHVREDGSLDFRDRELLKPVSVGEALGRLYPPSDGAPGLRIDGRAIAAEAAPALVLRVGPGAELLADGRVLATSAGVVIYVEGQSIEVGRHYVHVADVDLRSGDLSMEGSIMVRGDVQRGFSVRATGDIEIKGGVEGGSAYAGGNLIVVGGVRGSEGSIVSATGDLSARHVERARLDSGGVLAVTDSVNSELSAVEIRIERSLRGGRAAVEIGLVTRDAGTPTAAAETVIEAAVPRDHPEADARGALNAAKAERVVAQRMSRSGTADRAKGGKFARELADVQRSELARKIERAQRQLALLPLAFIEVHGAAYAGVHVRIGEARLLLQNTTRNARFTLDSEHATIRTEGATK